MLRQAAPVTALQVAGGLLERGGHDISWQVEVLAQVVDTLVCQEPA